MKLLTISARLVAVAAALAAIAPPAVHAAQPAGQQIGAVIAPPVNDRETRRSLPPSPVLAQARSDSRVTPARDAVPRGSVAPTRPWGGLKLDLSLASPR